MRIITKRALLLSVVWGLAGFGLLACFSLLLWRLYPYPQNATELDIKITWGIHILVEKVFGYIILVICAFGAAFPLRCDWKHGWAAAIGSGIVYQLVSIITYITRFGFVAYTENNRFWATLVFTLSLSALCGFICVWKSYRCEQNKEMLTGRST